MAKTTLADIIVDEAAQREVDGIAELATSIDDVGLLEPVAIDSEGRLIYGYHRYLACKRLGWTTIETTTLTLDDQRVELARLDENLIHNEGTVLERAEWWKRRKQLYESLHPETKHGGAPAEQECDRSGKLKGKAAPKEDKMSSFGADVSCKIGRTCRTVRRYIQIPDGIPIATRDKIHATLDCPLRDRQADLLALAKMKGDPPRQKAVVNAVLKGKAKNVRVADKTYQEQLNAKQATGKGKALVTVTDWADWLPKQPECDLLLTDPPYATDVDDVDVFAASWLPVALAKVKPTGRAYVCIGPYPQELLAYIDAGRADMVLSQVLVWTYRNTMGPTPAADYKNNWQAILYFRGANVGPLDCEVKTERLTVLDINHPKNEALHQWQKPDEIAERFIRHATQPGDTVLDPFAGTGTFLLAARKLGRIGRGCDRSEEMVALAKKRGVSEG